MTTMPSPAQSRPANATPDYDRVWTDVYGDMQTAGPVHRHLRRIVRDLLRCIDYDSALDVGCGPGHNFDLVAEGRSLKRLSGADLSSWAVEQGRRAGRDVHQLDVQTARLEGQWDLVLSTMLLEHLPCDEAALANMRAMTRKYLLVATMAGDFEKYRPWDELMGHVRNYQRGELERKLASAGFTVRRVVYWGFPFYSPIARTLQNRVAVGTGTFSPVARLAAAVMYYLYFLNSHSKGDLVIALADAR